MTVRFCDGVNGNTRLDLDVSEDTIYVGEDDFDLGTPSFEGEPGSAGAQYGTRTITFKVVVCGTNSAALTLLSQIAVEVQREQNWLMVQYDDTLPAVWWPTYKAAPGVLDLSAATKNGVKIPGLWIITVNLIAEARSLGAPQTISAVTVTNDPATGTNRQRCVLPALKGDSPTLLSVLVTPSVSWQEFRPLMSLIRHNTPVAAPPAAVAWQAEFFTAGTDTTSGADSAYSGGTRLAVTFSSQPGMVTRLSGAAPAAPAPGRYRVLLRMARSDTSSTFAARLMQSYGTGLLAGNGTTGQFNRGPSNGSGHAQMVDLGEFAFPMGSNGLTATQVGSPAPPSIELQVQRITGTGSALLDYLVLIPVETTTTAGATTLTSLFRSIPFPTTRTGVWDADEETFRALDTVSGAPAMASTPTPEPAGQYLVADPACANVFHLHHEVDAITPTTGVDNPDSINATASVSFTYFPRYLNLAAA